MSGRINLTGHRYGRLRVIKEVEPDGYMRRWLCQCDCGSEPIAVRMSNLRTNHTTSCGCVQRERVSAANTDDLAGRKFGKLTAIKRSKEKPYKSNKVFWECACDCGNTVVVSSDKLKSGESRSCGCLRTVAGKYVQEYNEENLRVDGVMTHSLKRRVRVDSKTGVKGVEQRIRKGSINFRAHITVKGRRYYGTWRSSISEASRDRSLLEAKHHKPYLDALEAREHERD